MSSSETYTIVFGGKTGVGKSSTQRVLWNLDWPSDDAVACTIYPQVAFISNIKFPYLLYDKVRVVDMPGVGESIEADQVCLSYYQDWLPKANCLVWVTQADTRAYKRDQMFLIELKPMLKKDLLLIVALNKIDYLGVDENEQAFDKIQGVPSEDQLKQLHDKINDIFAIFKVVIDGTIPFGRDQIVPYTAVYKWGLPRLVNMIFKGENNGRDDN